MALIRRPAGSGMTVAVLTFGLMANLAPMETFAAVMPEITEAWGLTASQAGWIGGIYFGGYAACVYFASMRTRIFRGERTDIGHIFDPPPSIVLDAELGAPEEVALGYNPHEFALSVDHGQPADFVLQHHMCCLGHQTFRHN